MLIVTSWAATKVHHTLQRELAVVVDQGESVCRVVTVRVVEKTG